jgi:arsenate reductase
MPLSRTAIGALAGLPRRAKITSSIGNQQKEHTAVAIIYYHNPRCSTSRKALGMLRDKGVEPTIIEYLKDTPSKTELKRIAGLMGVHPREMLRRKEKDAVQAAGIDPATATAAEVINAMSDHPVLIERPIIVNGKQARLGRPPEKVLEAV